MAETVISGSYPIRNELLFDESGQPYPSNGVGVAMMTAYNKALYSDGILPNDLTAYSCTAVGGMRIEVKNGLLHGGGVFHFLETSEEIEIEPAGALAERKDLVVVQFALADKGFARIVVLKGKSLATDLIQTSDLYQKGICIVRARQNATELTQADITDVRLNPSFCGVSSGILQVGDTDILWRQFDTALTDFLTESTAEYQRQVAAWQAQTNIQQLDWQAQTDAQRSEWEEWFAMININIQIYATFNFDNLATLPGTTRKTIDQTDFEILEQIRTTIAQLLVAERSTNFIDADNIEVTEIVYQSGVMIRSTTIRTTFNPDGSITEVVY